MRSIEYPSFNPAEAQYSPLTGKGGNHAYRGGKVSRYACVEGKQSNMVGKHMNVVGGTLQSTGPPWLQASRSVDPPDPAKAFFLLSGAIKHIHMHDPTYIKHDAMRYVSRLLHNVLYA